MACRIGAVPGGQLDSVGLGRRDRRDGPAHVLDAAEEARLVEHAVVDGDVEAVAGRAEQTVEPRNLHRKPPFS
jgi:hypothetical protein